MTTVIFHCIFSSPASAQLISLTSPLQLSGPICPGPIEFTCVGTRVPFTFQWRLNDTFNGTYSFAGDTRPVSTPLDPPIPGVMAQVTSVSANEDGVTMNITSTLSGNASALDGSSVQCRAVTFISNIHMVDVIGKSSFIRLCVGVGWEFIQKVSFFVKYHMYIICLCQIYSY